MASGGGRWESPVSIMGTSTVHMVHKHIAAATSDALQKGNERLYASTSSQVWGVHMVVLKSLYKATYVILYRSYKPETTHILLYVTVSISQWHNRIHHVLKEHFKVQLLSQFFTMLCSHKFDIVNILPECFSSFCLFTKHVISGFVCLWIISDNDQCYDQTPVWCVYAPSRYRITYLNLWWCSIQAFYVDPWPYHPPNFSEIFQCFWKSC